MNVLHIPVTANVSVVGNVGGLKTEHLSHAKLLLKYEKPAYLRINPNIFNHVLPPVFYIYHLSSV